MDPANELLVCTISGHCFDRLLSPAEMEPDSVSQNVFLDFTYFDSCRTFYCTIQAH